MSMPFENQDLQPVLHLLNGSADVGHAFDSLQVATGEGDTLVVVTDTDKILAIRDLAGDLVKDDAVEP